MGECKYYCYGCATGECPKAANHLWIAGKITEKSDPKHWLLHGVYRAKEDAEKRCVDETWFVSPLPIGKTDPLADVIMDSSWPFIERFLRPMEQD